jgi:hypothetical protein
VFLDAQSHKHISIAGRIFATKRQLPRNAKVFFQSSEGRSPIPGVIDSIFSIGADSEDVSVLSLCIHPKKPILKEVHNLFSRFPNFGAELWLTELGSIMHIPVMQPLYHS